MEQKLLTLGLAVLVIGVVFISGCVKETSSVTPTPEAEEQVTEPTAPAEPTEEPTEAPTEEPAETQEGFLEEGVSGRPTGTAGWASNIAINEIKNINPDLKLVTIESYNPDDLYSAALDSEGKLLPGMEWRLEYRVPDVSLDEQPGYKVKVFDTGETELTETTSIGAIYPIEKWKLDSDELFEIAHQLKPGYEFGAISIIVGSEGPIAHIKPSPISHANLLGVHVETGEKLMELGFE